MIRFALGILMFAAFVCGAGLHAQAKTELCPSSLWYRPAVPATNDGRSTALVYGLVAASPRRIVSATIVAETDGGWYTWETSNVQLTARTNGESEATRRVAVFDKPVFVRHVWVKSARTSGETAYGWDAQGDVACGIPTFGRAAFQPQKPESPVGFPRETATPIAAPYSTNCQHPFAQASVTRATQPSYPLFSPKRSYVVQVEITVGQTDNLLDAWIYKSSGNKAVDASALAAARATSYASAISYCQKTDGYYLFRADFDPW